MGVIAAVLGMGLASGDADAAMAGAFYAAHHVLAKGALFLAVGVVAMSAEQHTATSATVASIPRSEK